MRFLEKFLTAWFCFYASFLTLALVLHAITGYDPTSECAALSGVTGVEAFVAAVIEVVKVREKAKTNKKAARAAESEDVI